MQKEIKILAIFLLAILFFSFLYIFYIKEDDKISETPLVTPPQIVSTPIAIDFTDDALTIVKEAIQAKNVLEVADIFDNGFSEKNHPGGWVYLEKLDYLRFSSIQVNLLNDNEKFFSELILEIGNNVEVDRDIFVDGLITSDSQLKNVPSNPDNFSHSNESLKIDSSTDILISTERASNSIVRIIIRK